MLTLSPSENHKSDAKAEKSNLDELALALPRARWLSFAPIEPQDFQLHITDSHVVLVCEKHQAQRHVFLQAIIATVPLLICLPLAYFTEAAWMSLVLITVAICGALEFSSTYAVWFAKNSQLAFFEKRFFLFSCKVKCHFSSESSLVIRVFEGPAKRNCRFGFENTGSRKYLFSISHPKPDAANDALTRFGQLIAESLDLRDVIIVSGTGKRAIVWKRQ